MMQAPGVEVVSDGNRSELDFVKEFRAFLSARSDCETSIDQVLEGRFVGELNRGIFEMSVTIVLRDVYIVLNVKLLFEFLIP